LPAALRQLKKFFTDSAILASPVLQTGQFALPVAAITVIDPQTATRAFLCFAGPARCDIATWEARRNKVCNCFQCGSLANSRTRSAHERQRSDYFVP
jgi:transposase